jgi:hypothetical protein
MEIREAKIVPDLRVYAVHNVSKEHGRRRLMALQAEGVIQPLKTPTGRTLLSFEEAERLASAL